MKVVYFFMLQMYRSVFVNPNCLTFIVRVNNHN